MPEECEHPKGIASGYCFVPTCSNYLYLDEEK
jgi:hypothetical protein